MTPQFGNCKDCAAWDITYVSPLCGEKCLCRRNPPSQSKFTYSYDGCWSFIPREVKSCDNCRLLGKCSPEGCSMSYESFWTPKETTP